jgi:hypothetical protein
MIKSVIDLENKTFTFEFEGDKSILSYIDSYVETNSTQCIVKGLIEYYNNEEQREAYKTILKTNRYYDIIIDAINKMMNKEKVVYTSNFIDNIDLFEKSMYPYFNSLVLNQ